MSSGQAIKRNVKARKALYTKLDTIPFGNTVKVNELSKLFTTRNSQILPKTISNFLKERDDFISLGKGTWQRIVVE